MLLFVEDSFLTGAKVPLLTKGNTTDAGDEREGKSCGGT